MEVEKKICGITGLVATSVLSAKAMEIKNKISNVAAFIAIPEFNRLLKYNFDERIKEVKKNLTT